MATAPLHRYAVTRKSARILAVASQGLDNRPRWNRSDDKVALLDTIRRLGVVQLDAVNAVARSHYLVLLSRLGTYDASALDSLLFPDRLLFEQWAHAASLIPVEYWPYFAALVRSRTRGPHRKLHRLGKNPDAVLHEVMSRIRAEGPLRSRDFEDPRGRSETWWDWKPAKYALEVLFETGKIMVDRRRGFQRFYDLSKRVLAHLPPSPKRTLQEWRRWATLKSLECLGVASANSIADYFRQEKDVVVRELRRLVDDGIVVICDIPGWRHTGYLRRADLPLLRRIEAGRVKPSFTTLLSPFDNLMWDRIRVKEIFNFEYSLELYVARTDRHNESGYYVMPILHDGSLVGRVDLRMDRATGTLIVKSVRLEPKVPVTRRLVRGLAVAVYEVLQFNRGLTLVIERTRPAALARLLDRQLSAGGTGNSRVGKP